MLLRNNLIIATPESVPDFIRTRSRIRTTLISSPGLSEYIRNYDHSVAGSYTWSGGVALRSEERPYCNCRTAAPP